MSAHTLEPSAQLGGRVCPPALLGDSLSWGVVLIVLQLVLQPPLHITFLLTSEPCQRFPPNPKGLRGAGCGWQLFLLSCPKED